MQSKYVRGGSVLAFKLPRAMNLFLARNQNALMIRKNLRSNFRNTVATSYVLLGVPIMCLRCGLGPPMGTSEGTFAFAFLCATTIASQRRTDSGRSHMKQATPLPVNDRSILKPRHRRVLCKDCEVAIAYTQPARRRRAKHPTPT